MAANQSVENLFGAIDEIISARIAKLDYDKTLKVTIVNNDDAGRGVYEVCEIGAEKTNVFEAHSEKTDYKVGDTVYVVIPLNDNNAANRIIIGRYLVEGDTNYTYVDPSDSYLDISGNLIENTKVPMPYGLTANYEPEQEIVLWELSGLALKGYSRLYLKGSFQSWLQSLDINSGIYGLRLYVIEKGKEQYPYEFNLSTREMYGNPYDFGTYFDQQVLINISDISEISGMQLRFRHNNDFYSDDGVRAVSIEKIDDDEIQLPPNIFVQAPYVSVGYDVSNFTEDDLRLYTYDEQSYNCQDAELQEKTIHARWIHVGDGTSAIAIDSPEKIPADEKDPTQPKIDVHWYEWSTNNKKEHHIAGKGWTEIESNLNQFNYSFWTDQDPLIELKKFKVIASIPSERYVSRHFEAEDEAYAAAKKINTSSAGAREAWDVIKNVLDGKKTPFDGKKDIEAIHDKEKNDGFDAIKYNQMLKVLDNYIAAQAKITYVSSSELIFPNEGYSPAEYAVQLVSDFQIKVDESGYNGSYILYNDTGYITNQGESTKVREFEATYKTLAPANLRVNVASSEMIVWYIPLTNTMIAAPQKGIEYNDEATVKRITVKLAPESGDDLSTTYYVNPSEGCKSADGLPVGQYTYIERIPGAREPDEQADGETIQKYSKQYFRIKDFYTQNETNNTVYCKIVVPNVPPYLAEASLTFGISGTNGTDVTFLLKMYEVGENANQSAKIITTTPATALTTGSLIGIVPELYDYNNKLIPDYFKTHTVTYGDYTGAGHFEIYQQNCSQYDTLDIKQEHELAKGILVKVKGAGTPSLDEGKGDFCILSASVPYNIVYEYEKYEADDNDGHKAGDYKLDNQGNRIIAKDADGNDKTRSDELIVYLPIPVRSDNQYSQIIGSSSIVYDRNGTNAKYYKDPYQLLDINRQQITNVSWIDRVAEVEGKDAATAERIRAFYPRVNANGLLTPLDTYVMSGISPLYCVYAKIDNHVVWTQPVLIIQNRYGSAMLNKWDGSLTINEKNGTILSTMVGAGKKEANNTFSGVLMGDVEAGAGFDDQNQNGIGLYGFHHGEQSFGFSINGTAFLGKGGHGRINFNGNKGTITSGNYIPNQQGMEIDLDGPDNLSSSIKAYGAGGSFELDTSKNSGNSISFALKANVHENNVDRAIGLFVADDTHHYISSINYNGKYRIGELAYYPSGLASEINPPSGEGNTLATQGMFIDLRNGWIDARNGIIANWRITEKTLETLDGSIVLDGDTASIYLGKITPDAYGNTATSKGNIYTASYSISGISNAETKNITNPTVETTENTGILSNDGYDGFRGVTIDLSGTDYSIEYDNFQSVEKVYYNKPTMVNKNNKVVYEYSNQWLVSDSSAALKLNNNALTQGVRLETGKIQEYRADGSLERNLGLIAWTPIRPLESELRTAESKKSNSWAFLGTEQNPWDYIYADNGIYIGGDLVVTHTFLNDLSNALNARMLAVNNLAAAALEKAAAAGGAAGGAAHAAGAAAAAARAAAESIADVVSKLDGAKFITNQIVINTGHDTGSAIRYDTLTFTANKDGNGGLTGGVTTEANHESTAVNAYNIMMGRGANNGYFTKSDTIWYTLFKMSSHAHTIDFSESGGVITLTLHGLGGEDGTTSSFNMAATKFFTDSIAAAKQEGYAAAVNNSRKSGNTVTIPRGTFTNQKTTSYTASVDHNFDWDYKYSTTGTDGYTYYRRITSDCSTSVSWSVS